MSICYKCWWSEGGRCYEGTPKKDENGISLVIADRKQCDEFQSFSKTFNAGTSNIIDAIDSQRLVSRHE